MSSTSTVQVPQTCDSQESLTPVRRQRARRTSASVSRGSISRDAGFPFSSKAIFTGGPFLIECANWRAHRLLIERANRRVHQWRIERADSGLQRVQIAPEY